MLTTAGLQAAAEGLTNPAEPRSSAIFVAT
jgi:hypothetical protein